MKPTIILSLLALSFFTSCKKEDTGSSSTTPAALAGSVSTTISTGSWRVTYFFDHNTDETSKFAGYVFTFGASGIITAVKGSSTVTGTWSTGNDDSHAKLFLAFSAPADFSEISDDWHIVTRTDNKITLQDVSGGNGGTDYLTFEKN